MSRENLLLEWDLPADKGGRTVISIKGIVTDNILYTFKDVACSLREVALKPTPSSPNVLKLGIEVPKHHGTTTVSLELPIPKGEVESAKQAAEKLRSRYLTTLRP